jgi:hypothetical protein
LHAIIVRRRVSGIGMGARFVFSGWLSVSEEGVVGMDASIPICNAVGLYMREAPFHGLSSFRLGLSKSMLGGG